MADHRWVPYSAAARAQHHANFTEPKNTGETSRLQKLMEESATTTRLGKETARNGGWQLPSQNDAAQGDQLDDNAASIHKLLLGLIY